MICSVRALPMKVCSSTKVMLPIHRGRAISRNKIKPTYLTCCCCNKYIYISIAKYRCMHSWIMELSRFKQKKTKRSKTTEKGIFTLTENICTFTSESWTHSILNTASSPWSSKKLYPATGKPRSEIIHSINYYIIHSKYFPVSDWLKSHA